MPCQACGKSRVQPLANCRRQAFALKFPDRGELECNREYYADHHLPGIEFRAEVQANGGNEFWMVVNRLEGRLSARRNADTSGRSTLRIPRPKLVRMVKNNPAFRLVKPIFRIAMLLVPELTIYNCSDSYRTRQP